MAYHTFTDSHVFTMPYAIAIEIGGTKLQVGIGSGGRLSTVIRENVQPTLGAAAILDRIPALVDQAIAESGVTAKHVVGVGIGFGGPVQTSTGRTLKSHQVDGWDDFPLRDWVQERLGLPVTIDNDSNLAGGAEAREGADHGYDRVFYTNIGSGIGGAFLQHGVCDAGQGLGGGELGHTWVPHPETGKAVRLEDVCSGWSLARRARDTIETGEETSLLQYSDGVESVTSKTVFEAADHGDTVANRLIEQTFVTWSIAVGNVIALLHPQIVVLGGGMSLMSESYWTRLQIALDPFVFPLYRDSVELRPASLGEDVVLVGAMLLGLELEG